MSKTARDTKPPELGSDLTSYYERVLQPVGQMSLFEPHVTHRQMWKHITSGELIDAPLRPFRSGPIV